MPKRLSDDCTDAGNHIKIGWWHPIVSGDVKADETTTVGGATKSFDESQAFALLVVNTNSSVLFADDVPGVRSSRRMTRLLANRVNRLAELVHPKDPSRMLYVFRARSARSEEPKLSHCHAEARAVDVISAKFFSRVDDRVPPDWIGSITFPGGLTNDEFFMIRVEDGTVEFAISDSEPSTAGTLLKAGESKQVGKKDAPRLWIKSKTADLAKITLFTVELDADKLPELGCSARQAVFPFVWHYKSGTPYWADLKINGLHCSVPASTLRMLYSELSNEKSKKRGEVLEQNKEGDPVPPRTPWEELEQDLHDLGWKAWFNHTSDLGGLHRPLVILPGDEMLVPSVQIVPVEYSTGLTYGDVLLQTAWSRGLTPRPIYLSEADRTEGRIALRFIHVPVAHMSVSATRPPTLETLEIAALHYPGPDGFWTCQKSLRGKPLSTILVELTDEKTDPKAHYRGIKVVAHASLLPQYVGIKQEEALPVGATFVEIMDTIAMKLLADWDWYGEGRAFMVPKPGYGACTA